MFFCVETAGFAKLLETILCFSYHRRPLVVFDFHVLRLVLKVNVVKHHINQFGSPTYDYICVPNDIQ